MEAGEIWLARVALTDGSGAKIRPALVLWPDGLDAVVAAVTTMAPRTPTDVELTDWEAAGLDRRSWVRLRRLDTFESPLLFRRLGMLSAGDREHIADVWLREMTLFA